MLSLGSTFLWNWRKRRISRLYSGEGNWVQLNPSVSLSHFSPFPCESSAGHMPPASVAVVKTMPNRRKKPRGMAPNGTGETSRIGAKKGGSKGEREFFDWHKIRWTDGYHHVVRWSYQSGGRREGAVSENSGLWTLIWWGEGRADDGAGKVQFSEERERIQAAADQEEIWGIKYEEGICVRLIEGI